MIILCDTRQQANKHKIKEWEEKQKQTDDEIKVGDEIFRKDRKECKVVVTGLYKDNFADAINYQGSGFYVNLDEYMKTGRNFLQIGEVLERLKGDK